MRLKSAKWRFQTHTLCPFEGSLRLPRPANEFIFFRSVYKHILAAAGQNEGDVHGTFLPYFTIPRLVPGSIPPWHSSVVCPPGSQVLFWSIFFQHLGEVQRLRIYQRRSPVSGWKHITHSQIGSSSQAGIQKNHWNHHLNHVLNCVFDHVWCCFPPPNHYLYEVTWGQYMKVTQHLDHVWGEDATMS